MRYCVCVDYGHGETTATAIDLESGELFRLNIFPAGSGEEKKVESCLCKDNYYAHLNFQKCFNKENGDVLCYDEQTKECNFDYCIACSSAWGKDEEDINGITDRYMSYFNEAILFMAITEYFYLTSGFSTTKN